MKSYGTVTIQDGVYNYDMPPSSQRGFASYSDFRKEVMPRLSFRPASVKTFVVNLNYVKARYVYREGLSPSATRIPTSYSKEYKRIAPDKNTVADLKSFVAQFAGCDEADKLRKRIVALTQLHGSVSSESFRFGVNET
jgi:hypothetical protein